MSTVPVNVAPSAEDAESDARPFVVGTTGWTADDLDDPEIERQWEQGRYEIVEGVLTQMAAAYFDGGCGLVRLIVIVQAYLDAKKISGKFAVETDVVLKSMRVPRIDAVYLDADALARQEKINAASRRPRGRWGRIKVPPTLGIESISPGHEAHDEVIKRQWYAEAGVPHYWLLNAFSRSLECLVLDGATYRCEQSGHGNEEVRPSLFPGLVIPLAQIWA
jgi:Uma2 family endonuclease